MKKENKKYVFGPVPSRRLGRSLGVDLIPYKTCTYDCVYCQIGKADCTTVERREYVPAREVIAQLEHRLEGGARPDVITISGSGEPTLHTGLGEIIGAIKRMTDTPVTVLTNGSLLYLEEVREALSLADIVAPNLDAGSPELWRKVCRPHPSLDFEQVLAGLETFARGYKGRLLIEVFLMGGVSDKESEVERIAAIASRLVDASVQINTVTRPPAENSAAPAERERLIELANLFSPPAEVIADFRSKNRSEGTSKTSGEEVLEMLARRPCTLEDIAAGMGAELGEAEAAVEALLAKKRIVSAKRADKTYFQLPRDGE